MLYRETLKKCSGGGKFVCNKLSYFLIWLNLRSRQLLKTILIGLFNEAEFHNTITRISLHESLSEEIVVRVQQCVCSYL